MFQKLTPISDAELGVYEKALDFVFENSDVTNIAITGPYGSGKTSIIESYKEQRKHKGFEENKDFLHISFAHFETLDQRSGEKDSNKEIQMLESKILNQLLQQVSEEVVEETNFSVRKRRLKDPERIGLVACGGVFSGMLSILFYSMAVGVERWYLAEIFSVLFFFCGGYIFYRILRSQYKNSAFKRISFKGAGIELFEKDEDAVFDKYLNEIVYLFANSGTANIVFEDIDRFSNNRIFERLREINGLVNIRRKEEGTAPIRFFYLIRDDLFSPKDKNKFFDCTIPIVPVLGYANSYDHLLKYLEATNLFVIERDFDEQFLKDVSLYIDEIRILKNITNEFLIYYKRLNMIELDLNKLFAIILYKNLFPRDFHELLSHKGAMYKFFATKDAKDLETQWKYLKVPGEDDYIDLLKYLLKNNYIDDTYPDYLSSFYGKSISMTDKNFVLSVINGRPKNADYKLKNMEESINLVGEERFSRPEVQNYTLFEYLLKHCNQYQKEFDLMLDQLKKNTKLSFVDGFIGHISDDSLRVLVQTFYKEWNGFVESMLKADSFSEASRKKYVLACIYHLKEEKILQLSEEYPDLRKYIAETCALFDIANDQVPEVIKKIKSLNVKIKQFDCKTVNKEFLRAIYQQNLYEINLENIKLMLALFAQTDIKESSGKLLSIIESDEERAIYGYYASSKDDFVKCIAAGTKKITDTEQVVVKIFNDSIEDQNKNRYLSKLGTVVRDLNLIKEVEWRKRLFEERLAQINGGNLYCYFEDCGEKIADNLIQIVEETSEKISFDEVPYEQRKVFLNAVIVNEKMQDLQVSKLVKALDVKDYELSKEKFPEKKRLAYLVNNKMLAMNDTNLQIFRNLFKDMLVKFCKMNIAEYLVLMEDEEECTKDEIQFVLDERTIEDEKKIELLKKYGESISIKGKAYSAKVVVYILQNNFYEDDWDYLMDYYEKFSEDVREAIAQKGLDKTTWIKEHLSEISLDLCNRILSKQELSEENKVCLTLFLIESKLETPKAFIELMALINQEPEKYKNMFIRGNPARVAATEFNKSILNRLKEKEWIKAYTVEGGKIKVQKNKLYYLK